MNKLWQSGPPLNPLVETFTKGDDPELDLHLLSYDIQGTIVHARGLVAASILNKEEFKAIRQCLYELKVKALGKEVVFPEGTEDCHSYIENYLAEKLGETGKKIHAGRSRNDQVLTALRLYQKAELGVISKSLECLISALANKAAAWNHVTMPGFSHGRQGMLVSLSLWFDSWKELLQEDNCFCRSASALLEKSPLGCGAGFGNSLNLNRKFVADALGFKAILKNPLAAMGRRGKDELLCLQALSQVMTTAGKLATELLTFTSESYNYFSLPAEFLTGSSMMPNKNNYDLLEITRGNTSLVNGYMTQVASLIAGLGSGYHRDFQLAKSALVKGIELTKKSLEILTLVINNLLINQEEIENSISENAKQTEKVEMLVLRGIPFRDAYMRVKTGGA